ncbi:MAG: NapC/NirT family cytochrome c [Gammaproteobacteria bacterium]
MNTAKNDSLLSHPLAAVGTALVFYGGLFFGFLLLLDLATTTENPYTALVTFVIAPMVIILGVVLVLLSLWLQVRAAHRRGEKFTFHLAIDTSSPRYRRNLATFGGVSVVLLVVIAYTGVKAHDAIDSVEFCGETCHAVMGPQYAAYHNSAHARVRCVDCHVGPGFEHFVKAKMAGIRQLYAVAFNTFQRPIPTPVHALRPAQETCENCHWPRQFYGEKFVTHTYYKSDEQNSPWTVDLLVKIGGGNPRTGKLEGIHWHMLEGNVVEYIAADEQLQDIPWARVTRGDGEVVTYTQSPSTGGDIPDPDDPTVAVRRFDCMDCHNRPSHIFHPPANSVNLAMSQGRIATDLPYVRKKGVELLMAEYSTTDEAVTRIPQWLKDYYAKDYPDVARDKGEAIEQAGMTLVELYRENFFPEMKTDYRTRTNNLSHFTNSGCFRCHNDRMRSSAGDVLDKDCTTCHTIVAQGPSADLAELERELQGLSFKHPVEIGQAWRQMDCIVCHTHESGY